MITFVIDNFHICLAMSYYNMVPRDNHLPIEIPAEIYSIEIIRKNQLPACSNSVAQTKEFRPILDSLLHVHLFYCRFAI